MSRLTELTSGMIRVSHLSDSTLKRLSLIREAEACLLDYREPGSEISREDFWAMVDLIDDGVSPAAAAESVQARQK
jgi:hypothetical protein